MKNLFEIAKRMQDRLIEKEADYRDRQLVGDPGSPPFQVIPTETQDEPVGSEGGPAVGWRASALLSTHIKDQIKKMFGAHKDYMPFVKVFLDGESVGYFVYDPYEGEYNKAGNEVTEVNLSSKDVFKGKGTE
jgi:hypothetical protein